MRVMVVYLTTNLNLRMSVSFEERYLRDRIYYKNTEVKHFKQLIICWHIR